ncbi:TetR/AcrR family transcriptional regulator [Streptomyces sp. NPDC093225]|uniref:TetR/AcrR family transcriptional regulator n=1 Tax=Streptomyces sp. NPDC093225 TaxID=3366034 RepID=UPI00382FB3FB
MSPDADPRAARTRRKLGEALLEECAQRPLGEITVAAVVRRAGVGRATFYLHYADVPALAVDTCAGIARDAVEALHAWRGVPDPARPPAPLTDFLEGVARHADLHRTLLAPGGTGPLGEALHRELRERSRAERALAGGHSPELIASAVSGTFRAVLADWLHGAVDGTPQELAGEIWRLLITLHRHPTPGAGGPAATGAAPAG